jgi:hypothetical protein
MNTLLCPRGYRVGVWRGAAAALWCSELPDGLASAFDRHASRAYERVERVSLPVLCLDGPGDGGGPLDHERAVVEVGGHIGGCVEHGRILWAAAAAAARRARWQAPGPS